MPYRRFNGTSDTIKFSRGACDFTGPVTILAYVRPATGKASQTAGIYECLNEAGALKNYGFYSQGTTFNLECDNGSPPTERVGTSPTGFIVEETWSYIVVTKASGSAKPRFHIREGGVNSWFHTNASTTMVTPSLMGAGGFMDIGGGGDGFFWAGDIAAIGRWELAMSDAEVEALGAVSSLEKLSEKSPKGLWLLNQTDASLAVPDRSGNGAGQISISGTLAVNEEPAYIGFSTKEEPASPVPHRLALLGAGA